MELTPRGEKVKNLLIESGAFVEDEIDVLFKTEEDLLAYYAASIAATSSTIEDDSETEPEPEDDYRLNPAEEASLLETEKRRKREVDRAEFEKAKADQKAAPPVDFDDVLKSLEEGYGADDSNVPNN